MGWRYEITDTAQFTAVVLSHLIGAAISVTAVWAFSEWFYYLWETDDPQLFDILPLRYLFDAAAVAVIGRFVIRAYQHLVE